MRKKVWLLTFVMGLWLLCQTFMAFGVTKQKILIVKNINVIVRVNQEYRLPLTVAASMSDKTTKKIPVLWENRKVNTSNTGIFIYHGTMKGYTKKITLSLKVLPVTEKKQPPKTTPIPIPTLTPIPTPIPTLTPTPIPTSTPTPKVEPTLESSEMELQTDESKKLIVKNDDGALNWQSSDPYIVAVSKDGTVTGMHKAGVATITARTGNTVLQCKVTNHVAMRYQSAKEWMSTVKAGTNVPEALAFFDFSHRYGYDDFENGSSRIYFGFVLGDPQGDSYYFSNGGGGYLRKGDSAHQEVQLNGLPEQPTRQLHRVAINMFYHANSDGSVQQVKDGSLTVQVANARIRVGNQIYPLDELNGVHQLSMNANKDQNYQIWYCGGEFGYNIDNGLPDVAHLKGGAFEADVTIVDVKESEKPDKATYYMTWDEMKHATRKEFFDLLKKEGFDAVRLPITYTPHINNAFVVDSAWLDKVEEVVNWIVSNQMNCIINTHNDYLNYSWVGDRWSSAWMLPKYKDFVDRRFTMLWKQIAERFKDYDDYLLFESMNEPGMNYENYVAEGGDSGVFDQLQAKRVNELNALFYSTVQQSGGNNPKRILVYPCVSQLYGNLSQLELPQSNRIVASVHSYFFPRNDGQFTDTSSNIPADYGTIVEKTMKAITDFTTKTGVPIFIGECGTTLETENQARIEQASVLFNKANKIGVPCFWWEDGSYNWEEKNVRYGLFDPLALKCVHEDILQAIMNAVKK